VWRKSGLKISVVIRTRDTEKYFAELLEKLSLQTVRPSEIIVVDNFSTRENRQLLEERLSATMHRLNRPISSFKVIALSDSEFSHAYSTNLGVESAENDLVCLTNAHSIPTSSRWLQDGLRHFEDPRVAGVTGFFLPHREGKIRDKFDVLMYFFSQKMVLRQDWCSTINCIIRRSLWKLYPFDENLLKLIPETRKYGLEDYDWSKEMVARGYRIVVDPLFSVFHSHENWLDELERNMKGYFTYRRIQQKINSFERPRDSFSRVHITEESGRLL
jgi:rhamnosyltransferase